MTIQYETTKEECEKNIFGVCEGCEKAQSQKGSET